VVRFPPYVINGFHYGGPDAKSLGCWGGLLLSLKSFCSIMQLDFD
jgi:hypothetical protein